MSEEQKSDEEIIEEVKNRADQHTFLCERCKAINEDPEIRKEDKLIHVKDGMQDMLLEKDPDEMPENIEIDEENLVEQVIILWVCAVCKSDHRIITQRDPPTPRISNSTTSSNVSTSQIGDF
mgnify:CR=1 FL=1